MPAKPLTRISQKDEQTLYERYIAPVAAIAEGFDPARHFPDTPRLHAIEDYSPSAHVIADIAAWSYNGALKPLPERTVLTMLRLLDEGAKRESKTKSAYGHERIFGAALVETVCTEMNDNAPFSGDFLLYHMMAVMMLAVTLQNIERMSAADQMHYFLSMRVCLERANFSEIMQLQQRLNSPKQMAQKGGKQKFLSLYGPAYEYAKRRYAEIHSGKPRLSKMQIAKTIHKEAESRVEFRLMSQENRERTIYDWVRRM